MTRIDGNYANYNYGYYYEPQKSEYANLGWILAMAASGIIYKTLPSFSNPFFKQMKQEHSNNYLYKDSFIKSVQNSGLLEKGLSLVNVTDPANDIGKGLNACYIPAKRQIKLNQDKATISGFHELGHAINHLNSKLGKCLQKLRGPGYTIAAIMGIISLFSRTKPKEAKRDFMDVIQDNCGKIAFIAMLPTVAEEALASHNGVKMARKAGLAEPLVKNLKKFYGKAILSYIGYALVTGVSVFAASKIMETFTRPKKVEYYYQL